jgi:recombination protein RecA
MSKATTSEITNLAAALAQIEREFGEGSMRLLGDGPLAAVEAIPTGALSLDLALGIGGVPRGRIVELYGPESSGKTTVSYHLIAEAQRLGGRCAFIDAEHAMDPGYAAAIGIDTDDLLLSQPDYGEAALEMVDLLARSGEIALIVVDSAAALVPRAELEGQMGDQAVGLQSRMMSKAMRKLAGHLRSSGTLCLFTNQLRERIGVVYGPKETQPGGRALKYYASQRLDIRRIESLKDGKQAIGNRVRVKVAKNKVAAPFGVAEFDIDFGRGISKVGCVLDLAVEAGVVKRSGPHFAYGSERLGQGRAKAKALLEGRPELVEAIAREVREKLTKDSDSEHGKAREPDEDVADGSREEGVSAAGESEEKESPVKEAPVKVGELGLVVAA